MKLVSLKIVKRYAFASPEFWEMGQTCYCHELSVEVLKFRRGKKKRKVKKK